MTKPMAQVQYGETEVPDAEAFHLPSPSIWPIVSAAGFTLIGFGVLTSLVFTLGGLLLLAWGLGGWVQEMLDE